MNYFKTAILLAGLTALFMGVGYLIGGQTGALIALVVAAGMNFFAYWNSDKMVLSMHGAQEVDERAAPDLYRMVRDLAAPRRPADAARLSSWTIRSRTRSPPAAIPRTRRSRSPPACSTRSAATRSPA